MNQSNSFIHRHLGPNASEVKEMLQTIGVLSIDELINQTVPANIRLEQAVKLPEAISEYAYLKHIEQISAKNKVWKSYLGLGYYDTITPTVIQRNIFENPGWYTQYTPYQAEIAQGRLEALLNFQTVVSDLTGLPVANASLLDEGTAAAEAMQMLYRIKNKRNKKNPATVFLVADTCLPTTIDILKTRATPLGIELVITKPENFVFEAKVFGCLLQYPEQAGTVKGYEDVVTQAKDNDSFVVVAADLLSLAILTPPGEWGADVVVGNTQRFGVPMGYGGPHAAYFATKEDFVRQTPGRIIGVSIDENGNQAYRMTLQTREQHIRRDKATSNICTAQALLAIMASMYAVYHGPKGVKAIATTIHTLTTLLDKELQKLGYKQSNKHYFDTLLIDLSEHTETSGLRIKRVAALNEVNFRYFPENEDLIGISLDETCTLEEVQQIVTIFAEAINATTPNVTQIFNSNGIVYQNIPTHLQRTSSYLTNEVFNKHHSETQMLRYIKKLEAKDLSLAHSMIPLGSCTMKLNATTQLMPLSWPAFGQLHPFIPIEQAKGYQQIFEELEAYLSEITGFHACSLQPNSGAQGEYAGLMVIRAYHLDNGDDHRNIALIPASAHGTNPASAVMAGMKVVVVKCDELGNINVTDLKAKAAKHKDNLSCLMVTYPSTHGVFETSIQEVCQIIHEHGGQVYMDGANMNAQVGLTNPYTIGADVCHLNLHKTFSIPHGGGGPGMGPICVAEHLTPYLPGHLFAPTRSEKAIPAVSSANWSSASILLISYAYIRLLGKTGVTEATKYAILNANYIKERLQDAYQVLYVGEQGRVAHELIIDIRPFKKIANVGAEDVAKRLMDYGFHAPTVSFPVAGTIMIEPTESESLEELDRFCDAMLSIRKEIRDIELGLADDKDNVLLHAPHSIHEITADEWTHTYSRHQAAYPLPYLHTHKFWPPVKRVNNYHGDRNLICTCPSIEEYAEA